MAIKIQSTSDIEINSVKTIVYGGAGVGKTRLCATAPTPIIISAEKGLLSLADGDVSFIEISNMKEFNETYKWAKGSSEADMFESICLDSLSEIAEVLVAELKPQYKDGRQAYMALADAMMPMLRRFRDLDNKHTVFTSKLIRVTDEESGTVTEEILMPGKVLGNQIPYMVDELFKINVDRKGIDTLQTAPSRLSFAKDRSGALDNPEVLDMTVIINKIMAKQGN
jgi:hypothetical protein